MNAITKSNPIDYLVIGHLTADLTPTGISIGGTATFSGLTAHALGLRAGIITSFADNLDTSPFNHLWMLNIGAEKTTTFKNISDGINRIQYLFDTAEKITKDDLPAFDHPPEIIHLGPVANEVDPEILNCFPKSLKCLTPQGWFRSFNEKNQVIFQNWKNWERYLAQADIAVISQDDVQRDEDIIARMASAIPVLVVTENYKGARVYWHNDAHYINAPEVKYGDDTGAGDIFATAFFYRFFLTKDPWEAGRFAVQLASCSVTREHLNSIPTPEEITSAKMELLEN